jgi:anti-sigma regulatory factor (Ser/Thr protein kinase)
VSKTWCADVDLPRSELAASVARQLVETLLLAWSNPDLADMVEDARVVVSELVTNSVVHAGNGCVLRLHVLAYDHASLHLAVSDESPQAPVVRQPTSEAEDGRGLQIIQRLSARWGADIDPAGGKRVWAELR